ncbi:MAG TPA: LamG-like jellyroll fold domain-containing protein, partial [Verrucomicrobiae bacterium]|nr:LamG-like jellyroll fold domain-containing protein [Verrucomicrobiae bacterium]
NVAGPGVTIESAAGTYAGGATVSGGILSLSTAGSIAGPIAIAGNATFDVSEQAAPYSLASGQTLSNSGSTAIVNGSLNTGSGILSMLYAAGTPSLTVTTNNSANTNAAPATLTLSASTTLNIDNTGSALAPGSYLLISVGDGAVVAGVPPGTVNVTGGGIQAGNTAALSIGGDNQLYLVVAAKPPPPAIGQEFPMPYTNLFTLYSGSSPTFSIQASSSAPIYYQWFTNGVGVASATNSILTFSNVQAGTLAIDCAVSNYAGSATSMVWTASIIRSPAAYPTSVLALNPIGYWRLNDVNLDGPDNGNGDDGYIANDYAGGNNGIYTNVILGQTGYNPTADPSDSSAAFGDMSSFVNNLAGQIQGIDFAATNGANAEFTVEAWVQGQPGNEYTGGAVVTKGLYGLDDEFNLGMDASSTHHYRFYVRNAAGTVYTADSSFAPDSGWHHLAGVCDEASGKVSLYIDGQLAASTSIPANSGEYESADPLTIGAGITNDSPQGYTLQFFGNINDVAAFNYALTASQVAAQFTATGVAPALDPPPVAHATANGGGPLTIQAGALGTAPLYYWWQDVSAGTNVVAGSTNGSLLNAALMVNSVPPAWNNDTLNLVVSNAFGGTNFSVALTVFTNAPAITQNLPTPIFLLSGAPYTYSIAVNGASPDYFQWFSNSPPGAVAIANQTNTTYTAVAPAVGVTNLYFVVISNIFGVSTSTVSQLIGIGPPTSSYATNILALNPVGYWPMHEVEAAAHGDIETNYGSIGVLGTGYYGDWVGLQGIIHTNPGALANDPNPSITFAYSGAANTGDVTNSLIIPHNSPLDTLNPPFTVECWFYPNNTGGGDVWGQEGAVGLDDGPNFAGIRCYWHASTFALECYDGTNGSTLLGGPGMNSFAANAWHYVVVVDDGTNLYEYVDGALNATNKAANYAPDYWSPLSIGSSRGFSRSVNGSVDEFAVYTNALSVSDLNTHYNDGLSGANGQYKADVLADSPVIYLRMDSPPYTAPNLLPELINFGGARNVGFYSPGAFPGAIQGLPFLGLSGTNAAALSGVSTFADAGYNSAYNPIGQQPFTVSAILRGNPTDARDQSIVGHTTSSWRLWMSASGNLEWQVGGKTLGSAGIYNDGNWHQVVAVYSPASDPSVTGTNLLYVDGVLDSSVSTVSTNGITGGSTADVLIGSDPQYTNNPEALGQQFAGEICEVALFTNALSASQAQQLANADQSGPFISGQPLSGRTVSGGPGSYIYFGVDAGGTPPLGYQWYFNANPSYDGGTALVDGPHYSGSSTLQVTVTNLTAADSGYYFVVITNNFGSVTSILASLTVAVNSNPTNLTESFANNQLTLSWPADHTGWELEVQTNSLSSGLGTNWLPVASSTNVDQVVIPVNLTNGCVFYRLVYPPQ